MKEVSEYSNLSEDFILDEQELDRKLSNEQILEIQKTLNLKKIQDKLLR